MIHNYTFRCPDCGKILKVTQNGFALSEKLLSRVFMTLHENSYDSLTFYAEDEGSLKLVDIEVEMKG